MKHILVVGGAGYIGSHVALEFLLKGYRVSVLDNLSSGILENLVKGIQFIEGDILNRELLQKVFSQNFNGVIHLAGLKAAGESMKTPDQYSLQNIIGTINLLEAMNASSCRNFIFSSTASVYGDPEIIPMDEEHPINPINYYGFTKLEIERLLVWYEKLKGLQYISLRYFNAAGYDASGRISGIEAQPHNLIPIVMEVAAGKRDQIEVYGQDYPNPDGTCLRDYIHVTDLADAHFKAFEHIEKTKKSGVLNLGAEKTHSVLEVIQLTQKITGKPIPHKFTTRRPGDPHILCASSKKARETLGWIPKHSDLESIIQTTWEVYK